MNQKSLTPDERLLMKLYQIAMGNGDPFSEIDLPRIAPALGQKEVAVKNIVKLLAQANFIKKIDDTTICLTQHGCDFVIDFLNP
jgi:hypothetical protein